MSDESFTDAMTRMAAETVDETERRAIAALYGTEKGDDMDTPLWKILGWSEWAAPSGRRAVITPEGAWPSVELDDEYVTTDHLLDWLAERASSVCLGLLGAEHLVMAFIGAPIAATAPDRRAAMENVVRQVHAALGGRQ